MPAHGAPPDTATAHDGRPRILIVDDDLVVRMLLEEICTEYGWNAFGVGTSADAILSAGLQHIDLLLIDYHMKEDNALRLIRDLRAIRPTTPVVVVTGESPETVRAAVTAAGAHGVIGKPCSVAQVAQLLGRYRPVYVSLGEVCYGQPERDTSATEEPNRKDAR
jgi:CheY-like chemotaxis protein